MKTWWFLCRCCRKKLKVNVFREYQFFLRFIRLWFDRWLVLGNISVENIIKYLKKRTMEYRIVRVLPVIGSSLYQFVGDIVINRSHSVHIRVFSLFNFWAHVSWYSRRNVVFVFLLISMNIRQRKFYIFLSAYVKLFIYFHWQPFFYSYFSLFRQYCQISKESLGD